MTKFLFPLGQIVATPGAIDAMTIAGDVPTRFLNRHRSGDWGIMPEDDKLENNWAVQNEARIFSAYKTSKNVKLWVITEADRSSTTLLLPEEY